MSTTRVTRHIKARCFRISLTYDAPDASGKTRANTDTFHGRFTRLVPDREVVQVVEFETDAPDMQGEMTITYALTEDPDGGTQLIGLHEHLPPGVRPDENSVGPSRSASSQTSSNRPADRQPALSNASAVRSLAVG